MALASATAVSSFASRAASFSFSARAFAAIAGRDFVTPDDVVAMLNSVLGHRITLTAEAEIAGATRGEVLQSIMTKIEVPR